MSGIPKGWMVATVRELCRINPKHPSELLDSTPISFIPMASVSDVLGEITEHQTRPFGEVKNGYTHFAENDVIFAKITPCMENGKSAVAMGLNNFVGCGSTEFYVLRSEGAVLPSYLHKFLRQKTYRNAAAKSMTSAVGQARVPKDFVETTRIPIPPIPEQCRIVARVEALMARSRKAREALAEIPILLDHYRKAILNAAVTGSLTVDWRKTSVSSQNKENNFRDKEQKARKTARAATDGSLMSSLELSPLPSGWSWVPNRQLSNGKPSAICAGPFGTIFKAKDFRPQGVPIIFLRHVGEGRFITSKPGFMDPGVWQMHHQPYSIYGGELLVTKLGDPPGTACIYPVGRGTAMVTPDVMKMSVDGEVAETRYLMHFFNSSVSKQITRKLAFGVTRLRIDLAMFKDFPVPLPPLEEQKEIVRRIDHLFSILDGIAEAHQLASERLDVLDQSILAKAFRGELVPQDPNDEPAEVLLARIRAAREAEVAPTRRTRTPRFGSTVLPSSAAESAAPHQAKPVQSASPRMISRQTAPSVNVLDPNILQAFRQALSIQARWESDEDLLRAVAQNLGFQRLGSRIKVQLRQTLAQLQRHPDGTLTLPE